MTSLPNSADNYCYRHPNRQSFILCQRCGRTVCPECSVQAAVGVHCVECAKRDRNENPRMYRSAPRGRTFVRSLTRSDAPTMTYILIGLCVVVYALQLIPGLGVTQALWYAGAYTQPQTGVPFEPWRMLTAAFVHSPFSISAPWSILHILLNMYTLFIFGPIIERMLGRWRFLALYLVAGFGGSVAVDLLSDPASPVVGASGAIFGLMGAFFIINRHLGGDSRQILVLVALNLIAGFFLSGVSWQAHLGGLVAGGLVALVFVRTKRRDQRWMQVLGVAGVVVALMAITAVRSLFY